MFGWLQNRFVVVRDALTLKRVMAISAIFALASIAAASSERVGRWLTDGAGSDLFGAPPWAWGVIASLAILVWFLIEYGVGLREDVTPKVAATFNAREAGITWALERQIDQKSGRPVGLEFKATYLRFRVSTTAKKAIRDCTAHLIALSKKAKPTDQFEAVDLPHVMSLTAPFDVLPYAPRMIDFLRCDETNSVLHPTIPWPFHLENVFNDLGTYRFVFAVEGHDVSTKLTVDVQWAGKWDRITAEQV